MLGLFEKIRRLLGMAGNSPSHSFYLVPQKYAVSFSTEVRNTSASVGSFTVVLPVPSSCDYQDIKGDIMFSPQRYSPRSDSLYNNKYAVWNISIPAGGSMAIQENFSILVRPRDISLDVVSGTIGDYTALDQEISAKYLGSNRFLKPEDSRVQKLAGELVGEEKEVARIIACLNEYVVSHLTYGNPITGLYSASDALEKEKIDCGGFDTLLGSLLMASGIPVRIVSGFFAGYSENSMHAWLEALLPNGKWFPLDPSMERLNRDNATKKSGKIGCVGSDRIALSWGCDIPIRVGEEEIKADILQNPLVISENARTAFSFKTVFFTSNLPSE